MATTTTAKVVMAFYDEDEKNFNVTLNNAKPTATDAQVKNLMDVMITKANIFQRPPSAKISAQLITTTSTDLDVAD